MPLISSGYLSELLTTIATNVSSKDVDGVDDCESDGADEDATADSSAIRFGSVCLRGESVVRASNAGLALPIQLLDS